MSTEYPGQGYQPAPSSVAKPPPAQTYPPSQAYPPAAQPPAGQHAYQPANPPAQPGPPNYAYGQAPPYAPAPAQSVSTNNTVVVTSQPASSTVVMQPPSEDHTVKAIVALVLSIFGLCLCGTSLLFLTCLIPAFILAIMALVSPRDAGASSSANASIGLCITVCVFSSVLLVVFGIAYGVAAANTVRLTRTCYSSASGYTYTYSC